MSCRSYLEEVHALPGSDVVGKKIVYKLYCVWVPGGRHDIRSLWGLYKMHETLWFCLVSGLNISDRSLGALL